MAGLIKHSKMPKAQPKQKHHHRKEEKSSNPKHGHKHGHDKIKDLMEEKSSNPKHGYKHGHKHDHDKMKDLKVEEVHPAVLSMSFLSQMARITDHLYLSGMNATTPKKLKDHNITFIINCTLEVPNAHGYNCMKIQVQDAPHSRLGAYFDQAADKIHDISKKKGRVLVHCVAGVSRSASICIAYLMKYHKMSLKQAYNHVRSKRPVIRPNAGFFRQLIEYEKKLFGKASVRMVNSPMGAIPDVYESQSRNMVYLTTYAAAFNH